MGRFTTFLQKALLGAMLCLPPVDSYAANRSAASSDGNLQATLIVLGPGDADGNGADALVLVDRRNGAKKTLLIAKYDEDHTRNLTSLSDPIFSLDNGYIYINSSDASPYRGAVHQINRRTGLVRFVTGGWALSVIRNGPHRGFLIVQKHLLYDRPQGGTYNPVFVVRPDGHREFMIPGSDNDDGELAVAPWLASRGWHAW